MRWVAYMPLRAGSKSIPDKNVRPLAGRPLFAWALQAALDSGAFDAVYAGSDSARIRDAVAARFGDRVGLIERSAETCTDTASSESAMAEFTARVPADVLCLVQATSPLTRPEDFRAARERLIAEELDSLLSAVSCKRFFWTAAGEPVNYDPARRPRRQDFPGWLMENGAFYFTRTRLLAATGVRLGGRIGVYRMAADTALEIDELADWALAENLLRRHRLRPRFGAIRALIVDVDGTLTDGGMYYGPEGEALKKFHTRDAHGLKLIAERGIRVGVVSAEDSPAVAARMRKIGIEDYYPGVADKLPLVSELARAWGLSLAEVGYVGDDSGDLECIAAVGTGCCPADAVAEVRARAAYACARAGGAGAVREICDLILDAFEAGSEGVEKS